MKRSTKIAAVAVSAAMVAACSTPGTTELDSTGDTDTTLGDAEVAGMVVMDAQSVNDLITEFDAMRIEVQASASPAVTDAWNVLEVQMANLIVSADSGGVPQDVMDDTLDAVQGVTTVIEAEGDEVAASLSAAWSGFVNRFATLAS